MRYMCIEYHIKVIMYHVSAQGVDERMINVHYYYYYPWSFRHWSRDVTVDWASNTKLLTYLLVEGSSLVSTTYSGHAPQRQGLAQFKNCLSPDWFWLLTLLVEVCFWDRKMI